MTENKFLLDTNIIIDVFAGKSDVAERIGKLDGFDISAVVLGEIYIGINRVANKAKHLKKLNDFLGLCSVYDIDAATAAYYGKITAGLFKKGKPLPVNDIWIAASVMQNKLTLITKDRHFAEISGLKVIFW